MNTYQDILKLEQAALAAQTEHRYESAINFRCEAITLTETLDRPRLKAVLFQRLGRALEMDGQVQKAVVAYEIGFQFLGSEGDSDIQAVVNSLKMVSKQFSGERQSALSAFHSPETAQDLAEAEADPLLAVKLLINIGNAYLAQPQEFPALNVYQQALSRLEIGQDPALQAHALTHIGIVHRRLGKLDLAASELTQALNLLQQHAEPVEQRTTLAALASLYRDQGEPAKALTIYQQALSYYAQVNDPHGQARTQVGLAKLYLKQNQFDLAQQTFQQALTLATQTGDKEAQWHAYAGLARAQAQAGNLNEAIHALKSSLKLIEERQDELRTDEGKASFIDSILEMYDQLLALYLQQAQSEPSAYADALAVAEESRAQALLDLMGSHRRKRLAQAQTIRPSRQRDFQERFTDSPVQMADHGPNSPVQSARGVPLHSPHQTAPAVVSPSDFDQMAQQAVHNPADAIRTFSRLAPSTPAHSGSVEESRPTEAPVSTSPQPPPLARLVFHTLPDQTAIFAVTPEGQVHGHVAPLGEEALTERVAQLRRALRVDDHPRGVRGLFWGESSSADDEKQATPLLHELYDILIAAVADVLPGDGTPVVLEPHGPLWLLPFAALQAADGVWLADRWPLLYSPSAHVLNDIRHEPDYGTPTNLKALIVGNPTMPILDILGDTIKLDPLPGAEQEAEAIAKLFPLERCRLLLRDEATCAAVKLLLSESGILHLATHGLADATKPLDSFIALADSAGLDGLLTARQVLSLELPADLVTLSACQTGLGKISGEGMIGLSRAFLVAGARSVLVSQWCVSDEATVALMTAFYRHYLAIDDKALALQRAMRELIGHPLYGHPRYWAAFVIVGAEA